MNLKHLRYISSCFDSMSLFELLLEEFLRREVHLLATEVFDAEPDPA